MATSSISSGVYGRRLGESRKLATTDKNSRKLSFLELLGGVTWPKYLLIEERESNIGIGVGFEAYFGPVPDERMY